VRTHGCIHSGSELGTDAHACWGFDRRQEFVDASLEFLTDGLRNGQRIVYVGSESVDEQRERLEPLGGVGAMIDEGALLLIDLTGIYKAGKPLDPHTQLSVYSAVTDAAIADGYAGIRVAAQVTNLVREPETWDAHLRWESMADRFMSVQPMSAMCGYQRDAVPEKLLAELSAVHPVSNAPAKTVPFRLFADEGDMVLSGDVDFLSVKALDRALETACDGTEPVVLDLRELGFIDPNGIEVLVRHTQRLEAECDCSVRNAPAAVERLCQMLGVEL
jgi:anti-anti-sigma regulatory factor